MLVAGERPAAARGRRAARAASSSCCSASTATAAPSSPADPGDELPGERRGPARPGAGALAGRGRAGRPRGRRCSTGTAATASARTAARRPRRARPGTCARARRCGAQHHPRTDPVVIMLVTDGDRALLGPPGALAARGATARWPGFVEPGESLEEAVAREVREEAGVRVADVRYRSSQPWPFPASLMLGFVGALGAAASPRSRDGELEDVRWFTREAIAGGERAAAAAHGHRPAPHRGVARRRRGAGRGRRARRQPTSSIFSKTRPAAVAFSSASLTTAPASAWWRRSRADPWSCRRRRPGRRRPGRRTGRGGRRRRGRRRRLVAATVVGRRRRRGRVGVGARLALELGVGVDGALDVVAVEEVDDEDAAVNETT